MNHSTESKHRTMIMLGVAGLFVLGCGVYVSVDSLSTVRLIQHFYDTEVLGLRQGGEMASYVQESRRNLIYALTASDPEQQAAYARQARSFDEPFDHTAARMSATPFNTRCHEALATVVQTWKEYLAVRNDIISRIQERQSGPALALDPGKARPAFERVERSGATLRQELAQLSVAQFTYARRALYRNLLEVGLLTVLRPHSCITWSSVSKGGGRRNSEG